MQLQKIQRALDDLRISYTYTEEDGLGSIDFIHRGLSYHIWEYADLDIPVGVDTNLRHAGHSEEIEGNYEELLCDWLFTYFKP